MQINYKTKLQVPEMVNEKGLSKKLLIFEQTHLYCIITMCLPKQHYIHIKKKSVNIFFR
jgi:hypothetical protein